MRLRAASEDGEQTEAYRKQSSTCLAREETFEEPLLFSLTIMTKRLDPNPTQRIQLYKEQACSCDIKLKYNSS